MHVPYHWAPHMKNLFRIAAIATIVASLAACAQFQTGLTKTNAWFNKYGPVIGKDIIMVANILVQAECSPALGAITSTEQNVLKIVAPSSSRAATVASVLQTNYDVAQQLCPLLKSIKTTVGPVPQVTPSQVVPATP